MMGSIAPECSDAVGVVVAGGSGTRMRAAGLGSSDVVKATLLLEGRTFLDRVLESLAAHVSRIFVVAREGQDLGLQAGMIAKPMHVIGDSVPGAGPLSALADGLQAAINDAAQCRRTPPSTAVIVSCDAPRLSPEVLRLVRDRLVPGVDWAVPMVGGHPQVLVSAMRMSMLPAVRSHLAEGRRDLKGVMHRVAVGTIDEETLRKVDPGLDSFLDVDTPEDARRIASRAAADRKPA